MIPLAGVEDAEFDAARQILGARLRDPFCEEAELIHPFHHRARESFNELALALESRGDQARFVCGHVRPAGGRLTIHPVAVIFDDGQRRSAVSSWIPQKTAASSGKETGEADAEMEPASPPPLVDFLQRLRRELSELFLSGVAQAPPETWARLTQTARQLGFVRLVEPIAALAEQLVARREPLEWDPAAAIRQTLELCLLMRLVDDDLPGPSDGSAP